MIFITAGVAAMPTTSGHDVFGRWPAGADFARNGHDDASIARRACNDGSGIRMDLLLVVMEMEMEMEPSSYL